jgi:hypothetical protein
LSGKFVISLDFELMWGLYDSAGPQRARASVLGAREAIPRILERLLAADLGCTWATVGLLLCRDREQMLALLQELAQGEDASEHYGRVLRYVDGQVGRDESEDPCHFADSLIRTIVATPRQELGTHSFSHYCCLQPGASAKQFMRELNAAADVSAALEARPCSLVFPRNQVLDSVVAELPAAGISAWRGHPPGMLYDERGRGAVRAFKRGARLLDAFLPLCRNLDHEPVLDADRPLNVPASRFLRPWSPALAAVHPLHTRRIRAEMTQAAQRGNDYHLWWHPHNFGEFQQQNLAALDGLLEHYQRLRVRHHWGNGGLADVAGERLQ